MFMKALALEVDRTVLIQKLNEAFGQWIALCAQKAHADGVPEEDLEKELQWMQQRQQELIARGTLQAMRLALRDIESAIAWVQPSH